MKISQKDRIINYIREFGSISSWEAYKDLGITQLRSENWPAQKRRLPVQNRMGNRTKQIWRENRLQEILFSGYGSREYKSYNTILGENLWNT